MKSSFATSLILSDWSDVVIQAPDHDLKMNMWQILQFYINLLTSLVHHMWGPALGDLVQ